MTAAGDSVDLDRRIAALRAALTAPGAAFAMTPVVVRGQTLRTFTDAPRTLADVWADSEVHGDRLYLIYGDERISYRQAHAIVAAVAAWMASQGVGRDDRVAIAMRNYPEWLLAFWACVALGATAVALNAWWTEAELSFVLGDAAPKIVFADAERLARLPRAEGGPTVVAVRAPAVAGAVAWETIAAAPGEVPDYGGDPDDDACIFYTSGTTGVPKGAQLTHRGCANTIAGVAFAYELGRRLASDDDVEKPAALPLPIALVTTPLFHVTACNTLAHPVTAFGGTLVLMYKWEAGEALRLIEAERVTTFAGVPTMTRELLSHPDLHRRDVTSLESLSGGGAPVPPDQVASVGAHATPMQPSTGFGMTETCGLVTSLAGEAYVHRPTSCGLPMPTFDLRVIDDSGAVMPMGATGELCVRGPGVIKGYLYQPSATADAIVNGWLHTGDIARIDADGYLHIVDRKKDVILRGGENVYCAEVEAACYQHPDVVEACAFSIPDERLGEVVAVAVHLRSGHSLNANALRAHTSDLIASFKVPTFVLITSEPLPRNASGKFERRKLRDLLTRSDSILK